MSPAHRLALLLCPTNHKEGRWVLTSFPGETLFHLVGQIYLACPLSSLVAPGDVPACHLPLDAGGEACSVTLPKGAPSWHRLAVVPSSHLQGDGLNRACPGLSARSSSALAAQTLAQPPAVSLSSASASAATPLPASSKPPQQRRSWCWASPSMGTWGTHGTGWAGVGRTTRAGPCPFLQPFFGHPREEGSDLHFSPPAQPQQDSHSAPAQPNRPA